MSHSKGPWSKAEDETLRQAYNIYGAQWTLVSTHVETRTDGQCLKRWMLLEEYKQNKKPIKYITLTNSKLTRNREFFLLYENLLKDSVFLIRVKDCVLD